MQIYFKPFPYIIWKLSFVIYIAYELESVKNWKKNLQNIRFYMVMLDTVDIITKYAMCIISFFMIISVLFNNSFFCMQLRSSRC